MVYSSSQITGGLKVGAKTRNLKMLMEMGLKVPDFVAISVDQVQELWDSRGFYKFSEVIQEKLSAKKYAVRSSALIEDSKDESFAGQFRTEVNVTPGNLAEALQKVVTQAERFLNGDLSKFSVLVQEYVEADYSGVLFTRNPSGGREMVCEYHKGIGEELVSGEVTPESFSCYWGQKYPAVLSGIESFLKNCKQIENKFDFPQDIEWCVHNGEYYFLQTRPVTTISAEEFVASKYLDVNLPKGEFFYEKNEISEIAPRPSAFTLELLKKIYAHDGPVKKVYTKFGIDYVANNFLVVVGNELYVDRQKELGTLFPAYYYREGDYVRPKLKFGGVLRTFKNFFALNKIGLSGVELLGQKLKNSLQKNCSFQNLEDALEHFLTDYLVVFEINLLSGKAIKNLENLVKNEDVSLAELLVVDGFGDVEIDISADVMGGMKGNSLDIADVSEFKSVVRKVGESPQVNEWFKHLPEWKKEFLKKNILAAQKYNVLREYGRWLTVKNVNYLRSQIGEVSQTREYEDMNKFSFPSLLTSVFVDKKQELLGVSPGVIEGKLVEASNVLQEGILVTKMLSPELTKYFDNISGIISEEGGMLSHLAIIAREKGIPVVVHADLKKLGLKIGDMVRMDGSKGEILSIDK